MEHPRYDPVLVTQADVEAFWVRICHPLGWARRDLWFVFVLPDGRTLPQIHDIQELPDLVEPDLTRNLVWIWREALREVPEGTSIAAMMCRPGSSRLTEADRCWAESILRATSELGVPLRPLHLASDEAIRPIPMDELHARPSSAWR